MTQVIDAYYAVIGERRTSEAALRRLFPTAHIAYGWNGYTDMVLQVQLNGKLTEEDVEVALKDKGIEARLYMTRPRLPKLPSAVETPFYGEGIS